jgi:hypothetical protein
VVFEMVEIIGKVQYPKVQPDGRVIAVDPKDLTRMSLGRREWFNSDGTAKSVAEMVGKDKVGPDDGDSLG